MLFSLRWVVTQDDGVEEERRGRGRRAWGQLGREEERREGAMLLVKRVKGGREAGWTEGRVRR